MAEPANRPKKSRLSQARGLVRGAQSAVFYAVSCAVGLAGLVLALAALAIIANGDPFGFVPLVLSSIPISLPIVVFRERSRDKALARFLIENVEGLQAGAPGPGGVTYTRDTVLVSYQARLSLVFVSLKFDSGFYLHGPSHRLPKLLYTLFTTLFGWWVVDWQVWLDNLAIIGNNVGDSNQATVAGLLGLEEPGAEADEAPAAGRLPE